MCLRNRVKRKEQNTGDSTRSNSLLKRKIVRIFCSYFSLATVSYNIMPREKILRSADKIKMKSDTLGPELTTAYLIIIIKNKALKY